MKHVSHLILSITFIFLLSCSKNDANIVDTPLETSKTYFPPLNSETWETATIAELNWNESELQPLLNYVEEKNSKSFIILHQGKIVVEKYYNAHTSSKVWYWASAGKTLTTAMADKC